MSRMERVPVDAGSPLADAPDMMRRLLAAAFALSLALPAPARPWTEEVIYFALTDRFCDGDPSNNVPAGWHACVAQGTTGAPMWGELYAEGTDASGNALHWFGYVGVPSTYRIILVTESGKVWVSDILNRRVLQSSVTVNWSDDTSAVTVSVPSTIPGYLLQFVATLVPTLLIEGALLLLFRYSWKKNWEAFLLVNVLTQGFLAVASVYVTAHNGVSAWYLFFFLLPAELIILLVELYLYAGCGFLTGHSKGRAAAYAITANLASAVLGYYLAEPVWRLVVSIL